MKYLVHMTVKPPENPGEEFERRRKAEKEMALELQKKGVWEHLWRVAGAYENYSVFEVASHQELHDILMNLPLGPWLEHKVTPLCVHPSALEANS